ncbi:MAG: pentapeptide repeat-containing protein [Chloroflexota bacterium]|nr:pentapeptide repeat-containing protein [Chloroflexota bacterium]
MIRNQRPAVRPPRLPEHFDGAGLAGGRLTDGETYDSLALSHDDLSGQHAEGVTLTGAHLTRVSLGGTHLEGLRLIDVRLTGCDLANARWPKSHWERVDCSECRAVGLLANEAPLRDVLFRECDLRLAQFRFARFKAVRFEQCDLREADFHGADLSGVVFARCDLRDADLTGTTLVGVDLRGSQVEGVRLGTKEVRGLIVDALQLLELVKFLGITVLPGAAGEALPAEGETA